MAVTATVPVKVPASGICKAAGNERWIAHTDGFCYLFNPDARYNFDEASSACRAAGANLASIHSDDDTAFLSTYIEHMPAGALSNGEKTMWLGLRKLDSGELIDDSPPLLTCRYGVTRLSYLLLKWLFQTF